MRMLDGRERFEMHNEMYLINPIVTECGHFLSGVDLILDSHLITGCVGSYAWTFCCRFHRYNVPRAIVDMVARLKFLYKEIELFAVELLIQRLGLPTKEIELPQGILGQRKIIVGEGPVDRLEHLLWSANLVED